MGQSLILLLFVFECGQSANILAYFPVPARSHHYFFEPILAELGRLGHRVDYYSPFDVKVSHPNVTRIPLEDYTKTLFNSSVPEPWYSFMLTPNDRELVYWMRVSAEVSKLAFESPPVQRLLRTTAHYDLLLHEGILYEEIGNVLAHKFNAPSVTLLAVRDGFTFNDITGLTTNPSYMVNFITKFSGEMNFFERLENAYSYFTVITLGYIPHLSQMQEVADKCYRYPGWKDRPTIYQLATDQALVLANAHPSIGSAYPRAPHFKEIGGAVLLPNKPLPKALNDFMNDAKDGVIYFSLGTIVDLETEGKHLKELFTTVFAKRKEQILWKWAGKPFKNPPKNIKFSEFFPQQDILGHPNLKLFITHGGLQSVYEAVHFAVPVILIPFFGDQSRNARDLDKIGCGISLDKTKISVASVDSAIEEVIEQPKYKQRMQQISAVFKDRPMDPVSEAAYWIEYVLKHGKNVLQPASLKLSFIQLHCLDVYAFVVFVIITAFYLTRRVVNMAGSRATTKRKIKS